MITNKTFSFLSLYSLVILFFLLLSGCSYWQNFWSETETDQPKQEKEIFPTSEGEKLFQEKKYTEALSVLTRERASGNLRAAFYERLILESGIDGLLPRPVQAREALTLLTLKFSELKRLAENDVEGSAVYLTAIALLYYRGLAPGSGTDLESALNFVQQAAKRDFTPAMNLATKINLEPEAPKTLFGLYNNAPSEAFNYSLKAAAAGDILAMGNLCALYRQGLGTTKDLLKAASWARKAADQTPPSMRAQNELGWFYEEGMAVTLDLPEAERWYQMAAKRGYPPAQLNLKRLKNKDKTSPALSNEIDY
jgi:TPR repeat protein